MCYNNIWGDFFMKKKLLLTLTVLGAFVFAGCGKKTTKETTKGNTTVSTTKKASTTKAITTKKSTEPVVLDGNIKYEYKYDASGNITELVKSYKKTDSSPYVAYKKEVMTYDTYNAITEKIYYKYDEEAGDFVKTYRFTQENNTSGNPLKTIECTYDGETDSWEESEMREFTYNGSSNYASSYIIYTYNDGAFQKNSRINNTYNSKGSIVETIREVWNKTENKWVNKTKSINNYSTDNKLMDLIDYEWKDNDWVNKGKGDITYYTDGNEHEYTYYLWKSNDWSFLSKSVYTYENGKKKEHISYQKYGEVIRASSKAEYLYGSDGKNYCLIGYSSSDGENWTYSYKDEYLSDKYDDYVYYRSYYWDSESSSWVETIE